MGKKKLQGADGINFQMQLTIKGLETVTFPKETLTNESGKDIAWIECLGGKVSAYVNLPHAVRPNNIQPFQLSDCIQIDLISDKVIEYMKAYRTYQRNDLTLAFVVKKRFADEGKEALAFVKFDEDTTIATVRDKVYAEINECRSDKLDNSTAGMDTLTKMPRFLLRFVVWILHKLDFYGKMPDFLIKTDPNHATCFISNLGSIGLKSGYHHLSNWGTNSIFVVIGEKKLTSVYNDEEGRTEMKETLDLGLTLDERIADGYYYSKTVKLVKYLLQNPELLELPAGEEVDYE